ncbi:MAG TPA: MipA/OmpV family protein [Rhodospirillales bacterium]|nr:MipA/OmpV family protein [Rhodospirillales bacterium]
MRGSFLMATATAVAIVCAGGPAAAQALGDIGGIEASDIGGGDTGLGRSNAIVGLGIGVSPDYEGSGSYQFGLVPFGRFSYLEHQQYLEFGPNPGSRTYQARLNVLPYEGIEMGPMLTYRPGRKNVESQAVRRLPNIDNGAEAGGFARYWLPLDLGRQRVGVDLAGAADISGAYDGWWMQPGLIYKAGVSESVSVTGRLYADYADKDYMQTYFGINANQSARSGLRERDADDGFKDVGLTLAVNWQFAKHWFTGASATYERLIADAASSPVTRNAGNQNQGSGGVFVGYKF